MGDGDTLQLVADEVALAFTPLVHALSSPGATLHFLRDLGWDFSASPRQVRQLHANVESLVAAVDTEVTAANLTEVLGRLAELTDQIYGLASVPHSELPVPDPAVFAAEFPEQLGKHLAARYLLGHHPVLAAVLKMLSLLVVEDVPAADGRLAYTRVALEWDRLEDVIARPVEAMRDTYRWGRDDFDLDRLYGDLTEVITGLGGQVRLLPYHPALYQFLTRDAAAAVPATYRYGLRWYLVELYRDNGWMPVMTVTLAGVPKTAAKPPGLALLPYAAADYSTGIELADDTALRFDIGARLDRGVAVMIRPGEPITVASDVLNGSTAPPVAADVTLSIEHRRADLDPVVILGSVGGSHVEYRTIALLAGVRAVGGRRGVFGELQLGGAAIVIRPSADDLDGFLAQLLPPDGLRAEADLTIVLDSVDGLRLKGSGGLEASYPVHRSFGPIDLTGLTAGVKAAGSGVRISIGAGVAAAIGPVKVRIDNIGLATCLDFAGQERNAGIAQVTERFQPPDGIGLSIDAGPVTGGGFLFFDAGEQRYAGAVRLDVEGLGLNAIGLLTTRLPGGAGGYSLLLLVTSSGFTPVPLGYGFTLTGVGGLFGVNRTVAIDAIRAGLRDHTLDSVLVFRDDPVPRAAQIVGALQRVFPPAQDRYVFGPMVSIEWGAPAVLTIDLAVLLELPSPLRLVLVGRMRALLPPTDERAALVKLRMDAVGVIEFDQRRASLDATLYDSSIAGFPLSGDLALRMSWSDQPGFALAIGGFHPRFTPPPGFPQLRRVSVPLSTGDNPRLRLEAYLALTSNTVQVGARLELRVEAAGFVLAGMLAFDALVQFAPFWLDLEIVGAIALMRASHVLMGVEVRLHLTGPAPWHATGSATFRVLFFKVHVCFDATFGQPQPVQAAQPVAIWPLLRAALGDVGNWAVGLPGTTAAAVTLRARPADGTEILAHPLGRVAVRQRVVPLQRDISRFANAAPADFHRFAIDAISIGAVAQTPATLYEPFAPAQYTAMSPDEQLAAPGYEQMPAGAEAPDPAPAAGPARPVTVEYETVVLGAAPPVTPYIPSGATVARLAETGAAAMARTWPAGRARYGGDAAPPIRLMAPRFVVRTRDTLTTPAEVPPTDGSYTSARQALAALARRDPRLALTVQITRREEAPT